MTAKRKGIKYDKSKMTIEDDFEETNRQINEDIELYGTAIEYQGEETIEEARRNGNYSLDQDTLDFFKLMRKRALKD